MSDECCARTRLECENDCDEYVKQLKQQLESCQSQLKEAVEVVEFYGNRFSWNFSQHPDHEYYAGAIKDDDSLLKYKEKNGDEFEDYCGGKRARKFLAKYRWEK